MIEIVALAVVVVSMMLAFRAGQWSEARRNRVRAAGYPFRSPEARMLDLRAERAKGSISSERAATLARQRVDPGPIPAGMSWHPINDGRRGIVEYSKPFPPGATGTVVVKTPEVADDFDPPSALLRPDEPAASVSNLKPSTARVPRRTVEEIESTPPDDEPRIPARRPVLGRDESGRLNFRGH